MVTRTTKTTADRRRNLFDAMDKHGARSAVAAHMVAIGRSQRERDNLEAARKARQDAEDERHDENW
jgi:hypothetical protein